jgi:hypothetical protein
MIVAIQESDEALNGWIRLFRDMKGSGTEEEVIISMTMTFLENPINTGPALLAVAIRRIVTLENERNKHA